jgi:hypothetical protein
MSLIRNETPNVMYDVAKPRATRYEQHYNRDRERTESRISRIDVATNFGK